MHHSHLFLPAILATCAILIGCESADTDATYWADKKASNETTVTTQAETQKTETTTQKADESAKTSVAQASANDSSSSSSSSSSDSSVDQVPFSSLKFTVGGFNGSGASLSSPRISGLRVSGKNLSYSWAGSNLSAWGLSNSDPNGAVACLFGQTSSGSWEGGKFDWISSSRTTRHLENIFDDPSYKWNFSKYPNPCNAAFVIISKDGKKRTNVIRTTWSR